MLKNTKVVYNYTHNAIGYGMVKNDTEEHYTNRTECFARADELRAREDVAFVLDGYWCPTCDYRVFYAYKA